MQAVHEPFSRDVSPVHTSYVDELAPAGLRCLHLPGPQGDGGSFCNISFFGTQALADEPGRDAPGVVVGQVMPFRLGTATPVAREYLDAVAQAGSDATPVAMRWA